MSFSSGPSRHKIPGAFCAFFVLLFCAANARADALLGFDFMISSKQAFARAAETGLEVVEEGKNKDARKESVFKGAAVDIASTGEKSKTRISFFKDRIESVAIIIEDAETDDVLAVEKFVYDIYGKPDLEEKVFSFRVKSWNLPDSKLVLSSSDGGVLKLSHTHLQTRKERRERDFAKDKLKDKRHPVQKMIDGDYSKPEYR